jgi:glycosyl transferase, family 25
MFEDFERILVVNLASRTDRRAETERELSRIGEKRAAFFEAIRPDGAGKFRNAGEQGCFLSHLTILKNCIGSRNALVMEDDVSFASDIGTRIRLLDKLPDNWDMLYLGHSQLPAKKTVWSGDGLVQVGASSEFIGMHCYAVNGGAIRKLAEFIELVLSRDKGDPNGGPMPVDGAINTARRYLNLTTFAIVPPLAYQRSSRTDIGKKRWFDEMPILREAANLSRKIKNAMTRKRK